MPTIIGAEYNAYPQFVRRYLSVAPRTVLFAARVDGAIGLGNGVNDPDLLGVWLDVDSNNIYMLHYDTETGDASDCEEGYTVEIGTAAGLRDIGIMYLRAPIDTVNKRIPVGEMPYGQVPVKDNYFIAIIKEVRPQQRVVRLVATERSSSGAMTNYIEYHDYDEPYVNQNHEIIPIANINQPSADPDYKVNARAAGFVDPITGFFRVVLTSEFSESMNGNTVTPTWSIDDCTLAVGTLNDVEIEIDCPPGYRLIKLVVTDDVTGVSSRPRFHPIHAHDNEDYPTIEFGTRGFLVRSDERIDGRRMEFEIFGQFDDATEDVFPRGALVVYWEEPYFAGEDIPELYIREFIGWIVSKEFDPERYLGRLTLKVYGVEGWMAEVLGGFGFQINDESRLSDKWFQMEEITCRRAIHYILREYTTVLLCANLYLPSVALFDQAEKVNKDKIFNQLKTIAEAFQCAVAVDSSNSIYVVQDPYFRTDGGAGVPVIVQIISDFLTKKGGLVVVESEGKSAGSVDGTGSHWDGVQAEPEIFASRAPGNYSGEGDGSQSRFWRVADQDHLNFLTAQLYIRVNTRFKSLSITLLCNADIVERAWQEFALIDYDEPTLTAYEITTASRFLISKISVAHSNSFGSARKRITWDLEEVLYAEQGTAITQIIHESEDYTPNPEPITFDFQPTLPPFELDLSDFPVAEFTPEPTAENPVPDPMAIGFAISHVTKKLMRSFHFIDERVIWEDITPPGENGNLVDYRAIYDDGGDTMHCYAVYHDPEASSEGVFTFWKCDAKTKPVVWTEEDQVDTDGTGFSGHGSIDFDDTTQLAAFAALSEDGVRVIRKEVDNWSDNGWEVIGSDAFTDDTVADRDIQLVVDGDKITVCGATGDQEYKLFQGAGETGAFAEITDTPTFDTPVNSLSYRGAELYAAAWNADGEGGAGGGDGNEYEEHVNSLGEDCVSEDPVVDDFTASDGGWTVVPNGGGAVSGGQGIYTNGVGWEDDNIVFAGGNSYRVVAIEKDLGSPVTLTDFYMDFLYTQGFVFGGSTDVSIHVALDGNILINQLLPTVPTSPATWSGTATGQVLQAILIVGHAIDSSDPGGTATITQIEYTVECPAGDIADPEPETSNSASFFSANTNGSSLGLEWDAIDDSPKQFDGFDGGFFEIQWNFNEHEDKKLLDMEWFLNIKYTSDQNDTPPGAVLRCRYKVTMKEVDQPPDFTEGELKWTLAASTLSGSGPYERIVTSLNMLTGLNFEGVQLEYLKCRVDVILPAINLYSSSEGETTAQWNIFTSPHGSGSPSVTYGEVSSAGSKAFRCDAYKTAPVWTDITPVPANSDEGSAGRCAKFKYGIAVDAITDTTIYMCGFDEVNSWIIKSVDSGDNWEAVEENAAKWLFVSDTTFLAGGEDTLFIAMNGLEEQIDRIGDMTRFEDPLPIGHAVVMTGF